ncbi:hypothetical protein [Paracoccus pantotrophus]|uniref:hypothetical protein n=1 Tax=Paracoccus pantotrophus TaxID=82367 RepID=UPI000F421A15|nr:hypothetical protein [Paracoccus pantotrophus]RNI20615.1 hypothetical protein EB844_00895 [Paracoccus pantotrophus]
MEPEILEITEARPDSYPVAEGVPEWIWQRIEAYCSQRWTPRTAMWVVCGDGCFRPTLTPAVITKVEEYERGTMVWQERPITNEARDVPLTRFTATVGADNPVPAVVIEAAKLLAEYIADTANRAGLRSMGSGELQLTYTRDRRAMAQAIQLSGAADLLRPYRRPR